MAKKYVYIAFGLFLFNIPLVLGQTANSLIVRDDSYTSANIMQYFELVEIS